MKVKVRAKSPGVVGDQRKNSGDIFEIEEKLISAIWMERVDSSGNPKKPNLLKRLFGRG